MKSELLAHIKQYWEFIVLFASGVAGGIKWLTVRKKNKDTSLSMLYEQLEDLRKKVIIQVEESVKSAEELAEKRRIINEFKAHCPECYERFIDETNKDENEEN